MKEYLVKYEPQEIDWSDNNSNICEFQVIKKEKNMKHIKNIFAI